MKRSGLKARAYSLVLALLVCTTAATADELSESVIKAGFIFNFLKFTELPAPGPAVDLCVIGDEAELSALRALDGKRLPSGPLTVRTGDSAMELAGCDALYVSHLSSDSDVLQRALGTKILTIGDDENFIERGGMIRFFRDGNKVRFEVDASALQRSELKVSSKVLMLAKIINGPGER